MLKYWYNGHNIQGRELYNPNSIIKYFIDSLLLAEKFKFESFWANTFNQNIMKAILNCNL